MKMQKYLSDFTVFSQRGFFAFDKTNLTVEDDDSYHLVLKPLVKFDIQNTNIKLFFQIPIIQSINIDTLVKLNLSELRGDW
jgi:hypothetical protein